MFEIVITFGIAFAVGYAFGSPKNIEQDVTKNVETEKCTISAISGPKAASGQTTVESVDAEHLSVVGSRGGGSSGSVSVKNVQTEKSDIHK
jgi:hypothetical protein